MATRRRDARPIRAADVITFIESCCFVPEGKLVGRPIRLAPFQRDFIEAVYDNRDGPTRRAFLSMGRKNAKSTICACLLLNHLCGPSARDRPNSQLYSCAQSRDQAAILFALAAKMIRMNSELANAVKIQESAKALSCPELGTRYRALSAEANTAFGLSPQFCVHDELGRVRGPRSSLYEALETATAGVEAPLSVIISTQAATDADLLSILLDDAITGHDPQTIVKLYAASLQADPFAEETIRAANPAFDFFMNKAEVLSMAAAAKRMAAREAEFRNLILNQRIESASPFIAPDVWKASGGEPWDLLGTTVFGGLDLSATSDLTALVLVGLDPLSGVWSVRPFFWLPEQGLRERAQADRVPYDLWTAEGFIEAVPGASISYEYVARRLRKLFEEYDIRRIAFDKWGMPHLVPWLMKAGFPEAAIAQQFLEFGQGFKSMSPALRDLESVLLERKLRHGGNPVLAMCAANAVVSSDPAGNRKLDKKKATGRIDGLVALTMALAAAPQHAPPRNTWRQGADHSRTAPGL
jgi:phage terminase large subunit-like protein